MAGERKLSLLMEVVLLRDQAVRLVLVRLWCLELEERLLYPL